MVIGVLLAASVAGVIALTLLLVFRRDLVGVDLSPRSLLRFYLYLASLAGVLVVVIGAAAIIDWGMAQLFGIEAVYGRAPLAPAMGDPYTAYAHEATLRMQNDLLRGLTLVVFGAIFYGGHRFARRRLGDPGETTSILRRAYDVLGTFVFGLATVILVPVGIYQALSVAILTPPSDVFVQGFGDSLAGGIVAAPVWLLYLLRVIRAGSARAVPTRPARQAPVPA